MKPTSSVVVPRERRIQNPAYHRLPILQRYHLNEETDCWEWLGYRMNKGYGRCKSAAGGTIQAHRAFYEHHVGPIPAGHDIHHRCGNRACVNPAHLEPLTRAENARRAPHKHTVLDWDKAREIREAMDALCQKYGVRPRTLAAIGERQIWVEEGR